MSEKRYTIVRVDSKCPAYENINLCDEENTTCEDCKASDNYGDTKEQLIQKTLQAIIIDIVKTAKVDDKKTIQILYKANYKLAKFIVEFLGVK